MYLPFNDARRLRKSDSDIAVSYTLVDGPAAPYPERMPYSDDELNANENAPAEDPGIFVKTQVNEWFFDSRIELGNSNSCIAF